MMSEMNNKKERKYHSYAVYKDVAPYFETLCRQHGFMYSKKKDSVLGKDNTPCHIIETDCTKGEFKILLDVANCDKKRYEKQIHTQILPVAVVNSTKLRKEYKMPGSYIIRAKEKEKLFAVI